MTDEQKSLFAQSTHDYSFLKLPENEKFFDFAICEYDLKEDNHIVGKTVAERVFFKDYNFAQEYFKTIPYIDYFCFQYEQGASGNKPNNKTTF